MSTFLVRWEVDLNANTPEEAARQALDIQRDSNSNVLQFDVEKLSTGEVKHIDLEYYDKKRL